MLAERAAASPRRDQKTAQSMTAPPDILRVLTSLNVLLANAERETPARQELAREVAASGRDRADKVRLLVDELHRRFVYCPDPVGAEVIGPIPLEYGMVGDVDDACLFLTRLARDLGIPCHIVAARYRGRCWTCFVAYQDEEGQWIGVDPLRQGTPFAIEELAVDAAPEPPLGR